MITIDFNKAYQIGDEINELVTYFSSIASSSEKINATNVASFSPNTSIVNKKIQSNMSEISDNISEFHLKYLSAVDKYRDACEKTKESVNQINSIDKEINTKIDGYSLSNIKSVDSVKKWQDE